MSTKTHICLTAVVGLLFFAALAAVNAAGLSGTISLELTNSAFKLVVTSVGDVVQVRFKDISSDLCVADGPYLYTAQRTNGAGPETFHGIQNVKITGSTDTIVIRGKLAGLNLEHCFALSTNRAFLEERIFLRNPTDGLIALGNFEAGFLRRVTDNGGQVLPEFAHDRWVAVPLRVRASDPKGFVNDFSIQQLITQSGYEPRVNQDIQYSQTPSRHRASEGWAWTHGNATLGIFTFNQENMLFSVVSTEKVPDGAALRFGGACMISGEPAALTRIAPGQTVDLGVVRYQSVRDGYTGAMYAFRAMLDEHGCHFPKDYNPPVHWEQLYDMPNAWTDRPHLYTKAIVEQEAQKGRDYSCEALYLDPGWDTDFGTFLWGEKWLGPRREFVQELQSKYGLKLALHCPLATWMSHPIISWGLGAVKSWPPEARRLPPAGAEVDLLVPAVREGRRNLALSPDAKPNASSVYLKGSLPIHQIAHLNDGWYGNSASWIADEMPAWAEVDLGNVHEIAEVRLGNDHAQRYTDRAATKIRILVATNYAADSSRPEWRTVAQSQDVPLQAENIYSFAPSAARWVRIELLKGGQDMPRLDEIEIYEATPVSEKEAAVFAKVARRGPRPQPVDQMSGPSLCLGSRQYREEAEKRLLANCADGAVFLMFDGNWWNGGCMNPQHSHPIPYRLEDHIRANLDLVQRVHAKYPKVLIELHDPVAGGSRVRITPVYYKYGLPGSYDENWGFELMWDPMADLKEGRARALYYYNLGCDVPLYLHIDLHNDNEHCVVLWWYASTCRHLGIGGTSPNPTVVEAQKQAMKRYRELDRFYKRGEFFGIDEEIHLHVLPGEKAFVVNLFNLSNQPRTISGSIALDQIGLDGNTHYDGSSPWGTVEDGKLKVSLKMEPWSARVAAFRGL